MKIENLFYGERIKLAAVREEDAEVMFKWGEDAKYLRNVDTDLALPYTLKQMESEGSPSSNEVYFRLRTLADDVLIGFVAIHGIEWNNRSGQLAIGIGNTDYRGKGFGAEAVGLILRYAFYELNLNRVGLDVIEYNTQAIRTYEKAGFQLEGRVRSAVLRDGNSYDRIMMGILYSEWSSTVQV
ncbi:N-acetyltransferase [Paenibacillus polymyxa]|uniref:GNAT family N-acetyltransferase n=1 Tax=Paenibacillus TaxID=44249 RepID=UPI0008FCAEBC|nr:MULTISPECIES: GNAT family protein [Paenibacillus]APB70535.2 N-acetyltransferase [Paenibacillus polymyxa]OMF46611.1 GNAT family N-acetyltransferase [Paenibacillus peoriae]WCM63970.1 GNAT family protein [Paenibacillus polymyxa]